MQNWQNSHDWLDQRTVLEGLSYVEIWEFFENCASPSTVNDVGKNLSILCLPEKEHVYLLHWAMLMFWLLKFSTWLQTINWEIIHSVSILTSTDCTFFTLEKVCAITTEIQEKIRGLVKLTTFKCRKSGYLYPNAVRLMYQELFITMNFSHNHATILKAPKARGVTD